jgi:1-acyl-sn-glycerol-3-phosphate acyltransferase
MTLLSPLLAAAGLLLLPLALRPRSAEPREVRGGLRLLWWLNRFLCMFWHRLELPTGLAPLPEQGPAILIANHTCGIDNFLLQAGCDRVLGFVIVQDWYDNPICRPFCRVIGAIPVKRDGRDIGPTREALRALAAGRVVPIFPEGRIIPTSGREFGEGRPGAALLALRSRAPVIPAYISGTPETSSVWKALVTPSHARVVFGPPIDLPSFLNNGRTDRDLREEVTDAFMHAIRSLRDRHAGCDGPMDGC